MLGGGAAAGSRGGAAESRRVSERRRAERRDDRCVRLLHEHDRALRRLAASYERDPSRQQDLVQDIWLAVWQALPRFRGECSERTFVFRIAHNRAVSHIEHWQRRRTDTLDDDAPLAAPRRIRSTRCPPRSGMSACGPRCRRSRLGCGRWSC